MNAEDFRRNLLSAGLLEASGMKGVYHRSFNFEKIMRGLESYISAAGGDEKRKQFYFSSLLDRSALVASGYLASFPNLVGSISSYAGVEKDLAPLLQSADLGGEWADFLSPTNLALCGAACHNLYPLLAGSSIPFEGLLYEIQASCFRHEPSDDPARMQSFSMREFVYLGTENGAIEHRDSWLRRGRDILLNLGLAVEVVAANDPFFGRGGKLLGAAQLEKVLKFEIVTPISSESPGAIGSGNYHESHFGDSFHLSLPDGSVAHTACIGFGLERTTLALLYTHGLNAELWPKEVRQRLLFSQNDREAD